MRGGTSHHERQLREVFEPRFLAMIEANKRTCRTGQKADETGKESNPSRGSREQKANETANDVKQRSESQAVGGPSGTPRDDRPLIRVRGGGLAEHTEAAGAVLAEYTRREPFSGFFVRGSLLVRPVRLPEARLS